MTAPSTTADPSAEPANLPVSEEPRDLTDPPEYQLVIRAGQIERLYWRDVWSYRDLLFQLAYRDIAVHYKQTLIGVAWAVLRPLLTMVAFVFIFRTVAGMSAPEGVSYPLLVLAGMLPWQMFATALTQSSNSLVENANLVSKVYFPRIIVPLSAMVVSLVDFLVCVPILALFMLAYGTLPTWRIVFLPAFLALGLLSAVSLSLWLCALNVRYRDVRYMIPFLVQFGFFASPVGYASGKVDETWRWLYMLNPMANVIDGVRWSLLGTRVDPPFYEPSFTVSLMIVACLLFGGAWYFRKTERSFADVI